MSDQKSERFSPYYKGLLPVDLVTSMALMYLPKDGTDWLPRLNDAHGRLAVCWLPISAAADVPSMLALDAFESMGYQYMEIENGEWRRRLSSVAWKHTTMFLRHCESVVRLDVAK